MLAKSINLELPRRVVVYYLLFCAGAVCWLVVADVAGTLSVLRRQVEQTMLAQLDRVAQQTMAEFQRGTDQHLQPLVERFRRELNLSYAAIVSPDNVYLAHSDRRLTGTSAAVTGGQTRDLAEGVVSLKIAREHDYLCEYRVPIQLRDQPSVNLRLAVVEPTAWSALCLTSGALPGVLFPPLLALTLGGLVLHRIVKPLASIEQQLRSAAVATTLADAQLQPIDARTPSSLGWNRLIQDVQHAWQQGGLEHKLAGVVEARRGGQLDDLLNALPDGIGVTDADGRLTFANQVLATLLPGAGEGQPPLGGDLVELLALETLAPDSPLLDPRLLGRAVVSEVGRTSGEIEQTLRVARHPVRSTGGAAGRHIWCVRDVTQQKLADAMRHQFLDSATHELRTPLANIKAYAETLAMAEMLDIESQKEFCNTINAEASRLARFIDDLLSVSSMEAGSLMLERKEVELGRLFEEVIAKVTPQMEKKRITFHAIFPEKYPHLKLDKDKFNVALVNLLGNAAKYTPEGGAVNFEVKVTDRHLRIDVQDTGVGIAAEELPRIFEKFFRSENPAVRKETGTGLGLSMAHEVIKLHGGELQVTSALGEGTTFTTLIPLN